MNNENEKYTVRINTSIPASEIEREILNAKRLLASRFFEELKYGEMITVQVVERKSPLSVDLEMRLGEVKQLKYLPKLPKKMGYLERIYFCIKVLRSGFAPIHYDIN